MKAALIRELGGGPELADRSEPSGEAIHEISAVSLNPIDINVAAGRYFGGHPEFPYVPGCEGVGRTPDGTRVYLFDDGLGLSRDGLLAERVAAPADLGIPLPDHVPDEVAAVCGIAGMAGWMPGAWRAPVREDDTVVVLGATGTVGLVATQAAKLLGAKRVVAVGRDPARLQRAAELGADATVSLEVDDLPAALKEAAGGPGPTYIVDMLWGAPAAAAIQSAAPGWRLVQVGQSAAAEASLTSAAIRGKMGEIYGYTDFAVAKPEFREQYLRLVGHAAAGEIVFDLETYPLRASRGSLAASGRRRRRKDRRHAPVSQVRAPDDGRPDGNHGRRRGRRGAPVLRSASEDPDPRARALIYTEDATFAMPGVLIDGRPAMLERLESGRFSSRSPSPRGRSSDGTIWRTPTGNSLASIGATRWRCDS